MSHPISEDERIDQFAATHAPPHLAIDMRIEEIIGNVTDHEALAAGTGHGKLPCNEWVRLHSLTRQSPFRMSLQIYWVVGSEGEMLTPGWRGIRLLPLAVAQITIDVEAA
jgi:hypothetical protein